ncbi:Rieske (2Fe-2S) protein [Streptomyces sp. MST-110588]|uniref:Rieske (2Fe-2S) protein n=1 Tax=Streptomyces sp. MST-110588 TaxID=2833628 RepID=UPI001F5E2615|nr:Rieske (2Fe-2S) protein [Streptomyces sp. MST-110588]UNO38729.1 Rieske (2Fe-2S) protein [Streptomyces sp. MST-110588]
MTQQESSAAERRTGGTTARRTVVVAAGAAGLAAALAACGSDAKGRQGDGTPARSAQPPTGSQGPGNGGGSSGAGAGAGHVLAKTSDIPEGGGKVFKDRKVVVTQPQAGRFKAFSAVCQHEGCIVGDVSGGTINCPCHGSKYDIADGSVKHGPARRGLPTADVKVKGGSLELG